MLAIALKFWLEGAKHGKIPPFLVPQSHRVLLNMAAGSNNTNGKFSTQHACWKQNHEEGANC